MYILYIYIYRKVLKQIEMSANSNFFPCEKYRLKLQLVHFHFSKIILYILYQEPILRATQYIPGIVQLQQQFYDLYHRRLDKTEATHISVGDFVKGLKIGMLLYVCSLKVRLTDFLSYIQNTRRDCSVKK